MHQKALGFNCMPKTSTPTQTSLVIRLLFEFAFDSVFVKLKQTNQQRLIPLTAPSCLSFSVNIDPGCAPKISDSNFCVANEAQTNAPSCLLNTHWTQPTPLKLRPLHEKMEGQNFWDEVTRPPGCRLSLTLVERSRPKYIDPQIKT